MKTKIKLFIVAILAMALFISCTTMVSVKNLVPSDVNMGQYKDLAITPTQIYSKSVSWPKIKQGDSDRDIDLSSFTSMNLQQQVANYTQNSLENSLSRSDFFNLTDPISTQNLITAGKVIGQSQKIFVDAGVSAILATKISDLDYNQTIEMDDATMINSIGVSTDSTNYYLHQEADIEISYSVIDVLQQNVITSGSIEKTAEKDTLVATWIDDYDGAGTEKFTQITHVAPDLEDLFEDCIDEIVEEIRNKLAPQYSYSNVFLMKNKPELKSVKNTYKVARKGNYTLAYNEFYNAWTSSRHIASGYNAAILLQAIGKMDEAEKLMEEVYNYSGNPKILDRLNTMKQNLKDYNQATLQITGEQKSGDTEVQLVTLENFFAN